MQALLKAGIARLPHPRPTPRAGSARRRRPMCTTAWGRPGRHSRCRALHGGRRIHHPRPRPDGTRLLREGGIPREAIEAITGPLIADLTPGRVEAPGQMERHYAPARAPAPLAATRNPERFHRLRGRQRRPEPVGDRQTWRGRAAPVLGASRRRGARAGTGRAAPSACPCFRTGDWDARSTTGSGAPRPRSDVADAGSGVAGLRRQHQRVDPERPQGGLPFPVHRGIRTRGRARPPPSTSHSRRSRPPADRAPTPHSPAPASA
jgi:hypothetical protein